MTDWLNIFRLRRDERRDAYDAGHYVHDLQTVARFEIGVACHLIRINRLTQFNPSLVSERAEKAKRHMREALEIRSRAAMILRAMREKDGFREGWEAAA